MIAKPRRWLSAASIAACLTPFTPIFAQDGADVVEEDFSAPIEACIRENAVRVEMAFESLTEATTFLVESVCLEPVAQAAEADQRRQRRRYRERLEAICAEVETADPFSPLTSRFAPECETLKYSDLEDELNYSVLVLNRSQPPPAMVSLAASLLLDARLAREAAAGD